MTTNPLEDIIERCHQRHGKPLRQRKTVVTSALYKKYYPYQCKVYCAYRYPVLLDDLELAGISFMPIGHAPAYEHGPRNFGADRFWDPQRQKYWPIRRWHESWGIQVYTGIPSARDGARWHDLDFTYQAIAAAPDAVFACIEALVNVVANPLLTMSKSGGLRFSCRVPEYLHPSTEEARQYIYKHTPTPENPDQQDVYLEIFGEEGYGRWDARYEILLGNLLEPPIIAKDILFAPIDTLRAVLHEPAPRKKKKLTGTVTDAPLSLGSHQLDLAKEAFMKRGFSYVRQANGFYLWTRYPGGEGGDAHVSLWESEGTVWLRASTPNVGLPTEATPLADVWDDTGILPPIPAAGLPVSEQVLAVRAGKLSPLAIKRRHPMLRASGHTKKVYESLEKKVVQIGRVFDRGVRILGLITEPGVEENPEVAAYIRNGGAICLNVPTTRLAEADEQRFQKRNVPSFARWKPRMYLWERVKEIPVDERMANPFQGGNVCEDPERCDALEKKGGNPRESICPQCPVYTACQQHGYLSRPAEFQRAQAQISEISELFFTPQHAELLEEILPGVNETERLCILKEPHTHELFLECKLSRNILEEWVVTWQGSALGSFAKFLLNAGEIKDKSHGDVVKRIRTAIQTFGWQEEELVRQMCQVNVSGRVVACGTVDVETGQELARFTIEFEGGASAYIPLDPNAAATLRAKGMPFFPLESFELNEAMKIPMQMAQAIQLGILDIETVQNIQEFPTVCRDPNWTFWHQLKRCFAHYTRDADTLIRWDDNVLLFWVPPVLHAGVKHLLVMSSTLSERHLRLVFRDEEVEVIRTEPIAWVAGNQVFQIRTGVYTRQAILDYDSTWDGRRLSKTGGDFFLGILAEIERDPSVKHAILTYNILINQLENFREKENVCLVTDFRAKNRRSRGRADAALEEAQVIWIVGTPEVGIDTVWRRAQILFGNHEKPLCYELERETESGCFKDKRVQSVYEEAVVRVLTQTIGRVRLDAFAGKKIVLITGYALPGITDRPETLLFDWEDFEVAGALDRLPEAIATRERFETERANLTAESSREKVEQVLGCSSRQANRVLMKLRGGKVQRVSFHEQICSLLEDGEKKTAELIAAIEGHPIAIKNELRRLVDIGEIVKVRRAVYALPKV